MSVNELSKIGLGTWKLGGDVVPNPNNDDDKDIAAILYAIKNGVNHIDTSESYSGGKSEEIVGRAIKKIRRENIFVSTKVREWNLEYDKLIESCYSSLDRLQIQYIDLYYVHKQNPDILIKDVCKALNFLLDKGVIKNVGLSNVTINTIKQYNKFLKKKVFAVQNQYNLVCRESQYKKVLEYCSENNIKFICWRPIVLSYPGVKDPFYSKGTYPLLDEIADKYNKTNVQIAVKWLTQQPNVYIIFKSNNIEHIREVLETSNFELSPEDWEKLDKNFPIRFNKGCTANEFFELY